MFDLRLSLPVLDRSSNRHAQGQGEAGATGIAARDSCVCQIVVPRDCEESWVSDADRGGEMNGVVPAQAVKLGEFASGLRQGAIDANHAKLSVQVVDRADRAAEGVCIDSTDPAG